MEKKEYSVEIGGRTLTAEFNDLVDQANGSVMLRYGDTTILVTAVMGRVREGLDYFPLSVEFEEKFYAVGAILGGRFRKKEGMPSEEAILSARVVDRTIRPLFNHAIRRDIQVVTTVLSLGEDDADVLAVIGASLALGTSDIPWDGPVSSVRIGKAKESDTFIINPTYTERKSEVEELDILACGKDGHINMVEVGSSEVPEHTIIDGIKTAIETHQILQTWQKEIITDRGKEKQSIPINTPSEELKELFASTIQPKMVEYVFGKEGAYALKDEWLTRFKEALPEDSVANAGDYFEEKVDELVHTEALQNDRRQDGRKMDEIRHLYAQAGGVSELIHGTGIFYRGGTHVLSALTLGGPEDAQLIDTIEAQNSSKHYLHYYNFPPFSVGETGRVGGFNRRAIGHGMLAEKALLPVLPKREQFPYTIRIVSETMASNGSSSQASVCGSTLALMDAGVPISAPVAGIAMGMMSDTKGNYKILTDIQGPEDHFGDMDFKVAGTKTGVTAVQMDVKVAGVAVDVLTEAFEQAKKARLEILAVMHEAISEPRSDINARAPKIVTTTVKEDQIGLVIGPGGKTINGIKDTTGVSDITIEDDGSVFITGLADAPEKAKAAIEALVHEYVVGEKFEHAEVTRLMDFGAFVKIGPNTEGLVHVSEIAPFRIAKVDSVLSEGEQVSVIIKEIDDRHRINLSIKDVDPEFATRKGVTPAAPTSSHGDKPHKPNGTDKS